MNLPVRKAQQNRKQQPQGRRRKAMPAEQPQPASKPVGLWHLAPPLSPPQPIPMLGDPTALIRSLGPPPLPGQEAVAEHYLAAVVERAAGLAIALAASVNLLAPARD